MGTLTLDYVRKDFEGRAIEALSIDDYQKFNPSILGLGDISLAGNYQQALSAAFDLEGFTDFCNQIDPHLVLPEFLSSFLSWLFIEIAGECSRKADNEQVFVWCRLPFFAKFTGDGVLFLWDTSELVDVELGNIVISLQIICDKYITSFLPQTKKQVSKAPARLRCGISRGQIVSVGDGNDFVGACINVSSRIQKLGQFTFAFSRRGFNIANCMKKDRQSKYTLIRTPIRGIGQEELVYVLNNEFKAIPEEERKKYIL